MKRRTLLLIITCIALIVTSIALAARGTPFHLLWEIPFGLKMENCLVKLQQEMPYEFIEVPNEADDNITALLSSRNAPIYYMDYPVDVAFIFASDRYSEACISFRHDEEYIDMTHDLDDVLDILEERAKTHWQKSLDTFFEVLQKMETEYHSDGSLIFAADEGAGQSIPLLSGEADKEDISRLMQSAQVASLSIAYDNISISLDKSLANGELPLYTIYMIYEGDA